MCGFTIYISRQNKQKNIDKGTLFHRGPDNFKTIVYKNITLAHWRLSIVDHSEKSNQPLNNRKYLFVYNGEIYDFKTLSKKNFKKEFNSDTKFLFDVLTKKNNLNIISNFSGFYAYSYLDKKKMRLTFSRDFLGKKPLFYYYDNEKFILSSEEKGILKFIEKKIDTNSLFQYFFFKNNFHGNTFFKNINSIAPGSKFNFDINKWKLKSNKSWDDFYQEKIFTNKNYKNFDETFYKILHNSIKVRNYCDVKTQLALSSGFDSTLILDLIKSKLKTKNFSRGISLGFNKKNDETVISKKINKFYKSKICSIKKDKIKLRELISIIKYYDAPLEHPSSIGIDTICKEARKLDKVLITGEGADDLLFGYDHYRSKQNKSFAFRPFIKKIIMKKILSTKSNFKIFNKIKKNHRINFYRNRALKSKFLSRELEVKTHMQTLLKRNDRISMKNSVEIRCPFLDIDLVRSIPSNKFYKKQKIFKKYFNKSIFKLINRKKKIGFFVPLSGIYNSNKKKINYFLFVAQEYLRKNGLIIEKKLLKNEEIK